MMKLFSNSAPLFSIVNFFSKCGWLAFVFGGVLCLQAQEPAVTSSARVQIVNATSVPEISLGLNGRPALASFFQGRSTPAMLMPSLSMSYQVRFSQSGPEIDSGAITYLPDSYQTMVIMGDFSTDTPPGNLPPPNSQAPASFKAYPPNLIFRTFTHEASASGESLGFRIVNGMPRQILTISNSTESKQILPGESATITGQSTSSFEALASGHKMTVSVPQRGHLNAMVIFYLKEGQPAYVRLFEETGKPRHSTRSGE